MSSESSVRFTGGEKAGNRKPTNIYRNMTVSKALGIVHIARIQSIKYHINYLRGEQRPCIENNNNSSFENIGKGISRVVRN